MADDIQVVQLLDVLDVNTINEAPGVVPRSIIIEGRDFRTVERVILNGFTSPAFVVLAKNSLIAQVPDEIIEDVIRDVFVLSNQLTDTKSSLVEFTFGTRPKTVSGVLRLMQLFIRMLLRSPGTNIFNKRLGGGLQAKIGTVIGNSPRSRSRAAADISIAVTRTRQQIINIQSPDRAIPPSERLVGADLSALTVDPENGQILMTIVLTSQSGIQSAATLAA
jgi:hypothetical protein